MKKIVLEPALLCQSNDSYKSGGTLGEKQNPKALLNA